MTFLIIYLRVKLDVNFVHNSSDAKVEVLSDVADDHVDPTLKSLSVYTDHKVLDICHGESIVVDVPISREVSHADNNCSGYSFV